jgi:Cof subfamily protein (haloacid dehalogenase superfamily)
MSIVGASTVKLVCIDLDGTLVGSSGSPTDAVWSAADRARKAGIHLAICTARPGTGLAWKWAKRLDPNGWHQFQAGASIMHTQTLQTHSAPLPDGAARLSYCAALANGWIFEAYSDADYIVDSDDPAAAAHADLLGIPYVRRSLTDLRGPVVRTHLIVTDAQLADALADTPPGCHALGATSPVMPGYNFVSVTAQGVSKASGVATLATLFGCDLAEVMMIGDGHNDVPAMRVVGHPVAMGNAPDDVATFARHRVAHVDADGVAEALDLAVQLGLAANRGTHQPEHDLVHD